MEAKRSGLSYHPLVKFMLIIIVGSTGFIVHSQYIALIPGLLFGLLLLASGEYIFAGGMLGAAVVLSMGATQLLTSPHGVWQALAQPLAAFWKIIVMVMSGRLFYITTETTDLLKALEALRMPHWLVVPLAVTLRFIPTLQVEFTAIRDAMRIRGIPVSFRGFLTQPGKQLEYILVPLLMRSARIADELSVSCITRGINSACAKTSYKTIAVSGRDYLLIAVSIAVCAGMLLMDLTFRLP